MTNLDEAQNFHALVVGGSGVTGQALIRELVARGWRATSLSRSQMVEIAGAKSVLTDLTDADAVSDVLAGDTFTHIFLSAWARRTTEAENILVNRAMVHNVLEATVPSGTVRHVALVTGLKHYFGPFEAFAVDTVRDTPFHEDEPRLEIDNFYYAQEDELWGYADKFGFGWSVHRSHTIIGSALGNAMNMGQTLAAQAAICRFEKKPFVFPGNEAQWNGITDMTDVGILARQMIWASSTVGLPSQAYNVANGDVFRWRWMWPRIAELLGVEPEGYSGEPRPLEVQMAGKDDVWHEIAEREGLVEAEINKVASWWHTDSDLNRPVECFTDMSRSRSAGFLDSIDTLSSFAKLFDSLRASKVIPS
ncbi:MAG: SDR family oxidoreductase [Gulosibacter sp.]|uniref:SDR family oxidoreductase n=1 Tax=Gulosibacter sp. TaxID=2817531 RepID=UPI003F92AD34